MSGDIERLVKLLALTHSDQDGEALNALRAAQRLIAPHGFKLGDMVGGQDRQHRYKAELDLVNRLREAQQRIDVLTHEIGRLRAERQQPVGNHFDQAPMTATQMRQAQEFQRQMLDEHLRVMRKQAS